MNHTVGQSYGLIFYFYFYFARDELRHRPMACSWPMGPKGKSTGVKVASFQEKFLLLIKKERLN